MRYISEEELRKWLITDGCEEGHGYIDEDDFVCMDWEDDPIKTGHWIPIQETIGVDKEGNEMSAIVGYMCSKCAERYRAKSFYCSHCGAKMVEPQESEG